MIRKYIRSYKIQLLKDIDWIIRKRELDRCLLQSSSSGISDQRYCDEDVIVSLTTYGKRLHEVYLAIESIMQQTMQPNRIILWLQADMKGMPLPITLQKQIKRGLEVMYCEDLLSYKKLIPTLIHFPSSVVITIDDDVVYEMEVVERLVNSYLQDPSMIYFNRGHLMTLKNGKPDRYLKWHRNVSDHPITPLNFPLGVGGILYPPHCFANEVLNKNVFMNICSHADDVWFKAMALYSGVSCRRVYTNDAAGEDFIINRNVQDVALSRRNMYEGGNDRQIAAVFEKYELYEKLQ